MRHRFSLEGDIYRLRPIQNEDASFVTELRSNPELNRFLHASSSKVEDQLAWFSAYFEREGDYYFVIERRSDNTAEGLIAIYDHDQPSGTAEWGRWILKPRSLAAVESAWLIYRFAFEVLGLTSVYCRTVADNGAVVSFHDSCGIAERSHLPGHFELGAKRYDAIEHRMSSLTWNDTKPKLEHLVQLTAKRIRRV
jgi:RimJ/RimL family protein N-acetyltransferase